MVAADFKYFGTMLAPGIGGLPRKNRVAKFFHQGHPYYSLAKSTVALLLDRQATRAVK